MSRSATRESHRIDAMIQAAAVLAAALIATRKIVDAGDAADVFRECYAAMWDRQKGLEDY
ncbi:MAG TPA: hypothetical protein VNR89_23460 [Roseomonas sp.]|nr:hypothetical protein [Roseomonas sp.]